MVRIPGYRAPGTDLDVPAGPVEPSSTSGFQAGCEPPAQKAQKSGSSLTLKMLTAHAEAQKIDLDGDPTAALRQAELDRARAQPDAPGWATDTRVSDAQFDRYVTYAQQAATLTAIPQKVLFGFTRLIDANFDLGGPAEIAARAIDPWRGGGASAASVIEALANASLDGHRAAARRPEDRERRRTRLLALIDRGPPDGGTVWRRPRDGLELVASLVRQLLLSPGDSEHLVLHDKLAAWLEEVLGDHGAPLREAMGGAGVFGANVGAAQTQVSSRFYAADGMPARVAARCGSRVQGVDADGRARTLDKCTTDESARVNYIANYPSDLSFSLFGREALSIDGKVRELKVQKGGRVILGKPGRQETTFGEVSDAVLRRIARTHTGIVLSGLDYHTAAPAGTCPLAEKLSAQLDVMRASNPDLEVHWIYKVPKVDENEPLLLRAMKGRLTSLDLNATELPGLLTRMTQAGLVDYRGPEFPPADQLQDPAFLLDGANLLIDAFGLKRLNVRGFPLNLLVQDGCEDPARQRSALLAACDVAMIKAATPSGEITGPEDLVATPQLFDGSGLAAVHAFADKLQADFGRDDDDAFHRSIVDRLWARAPDGERTYVVAPGRRFYSTEGSLVSCGDAMGVTGFLLGQERTPPGQLLHFETLSRGLADGA